MSVNRIKFHAEENLIAYKSEFEPQKPIRGVRTYDTKSEAKKFSTKKCIVRLNLIYRFFPLQVFLILEAAKRRTDTIEQAMLKPGRSMITLLLIINLAMWIINTFALKQGENSKIFNDYYSVTAWKIISNLSLPLIIFFRFHSTVCLAEIWTNAYRSPETYKVDV